MNALLPVSFLAAESRAKKAKIDNGKIAELREFVLLSKFSETKNVVLQRSTHFWRVEKYKVRKDW